MKLKVVIEPSDDGGYTAYVPSLPGCISEGDTREQTISNIREAIELYLEPVEDDLTPSPDTEIMETAVWPKYRVWGTRKLSGRCNATGKWLFSQKGFHIRLQKHMLAETLKLTQPAHRPLKKSTLSHILKQARLVSRRIPQTGSIRPAINFL